MEVKSCNGIQLAPLNEGDHNEIRLKDTNRLSEGCTELMYACTQGNAEKIIEELRSVVNMALYSFNDGIFPIKQWWLYFLNFLV